MILKILLIIISFEIGILLLNCYKYKVITSRSIRHIFKYAITSKSEWKKSKPKSQKYVEVKELDKKFPLKACPYNINEFKRTEEYSSPNIFFIICDGRRLDDFSLDSGKPNSAHDTPFIESLQNDCIFFPNVIAPNPWSYPSHTAIFSGLPPEISQSDLLQPYEGTFPNNCYSIAELLKTLGYATILFADHPFVLDGGLTNSLIRGFEYYDVIGKSPDFRSRTNLQSNHEDYETISKVKGRDYIISPQIIKTINDFNNGKIIYDLKAIGDLDERDGIIYPKIDDLYEDSPYFKERHLKDFKSLIKKDPNKPLFIFFNLHFCDFAVPDDRLLGEWIVQLLLANAQKQGKKLPVPIIDEDFIEYYKQCVKKITHVQDWQIKRHFDNRFYDYTIKKIYYFFKEKGLMDNSSFIVTSDHGVGFREHDEDLFFHEGARPYDYLVDVPLLLKMDRVNKFSNIHGRYDTRISLIDLFYTIVHVATGQDLNNGRVYIYNQDESQEQHNGKKCIEKYSIDSQFGKSLISRIEGNDWNEAIISVSNVISKYYKSEPYTMGKMIGLYLDNYKCMFGENMSVHYTLKFNPKNLSSLWSSDNVRTLSLLANPRNIFRPTTRGINYLFHLNNSEHYPLSNQNLVDKCKLLYKKRYGYTQMLMNILSLDLNSIEMEANVK